MVVKLFVISILFSVAFAAHLQFSNDNVETGSKWKKCVDVVELVSPVAKPLKVPEPIEDYATCLPDMDGSTNWFGVMAGITSLIPGGEFIAGISTILSSVNFGGSYTDDLDSCIKQMINEALENSDLQKCSGRMLQIEESKKNFIWALEQPLNDSYFMDYAAEKMAEITTQFLLIQNDYSQTGDGATDDRHHEKFLDFYFDSLATIGAMNTMLVDAMEKQELPTLEICTKSYILHHDMESRYQESFEYDGAFSLQRILDESVFHSWEIEKLWVREDIISSMGSIVYDTYVHDDYRGEKNGDDSFTCSKCMHADTLFTHEGSCEIESNGEDLPELDDWIGNPKAVCEHCQLYAANQNSVRRQQIDDAGKNFQNMMKAIQEIQERLECQFFLTEELTQL